LLASWPKLDETALEKDELEIVVQVNGKLRGRVSGSPSLTREQWQDLAQGNENVHKFLEGKSIVKIIVVPGKIINIVVR
jgi:leucyl-tRNA synthetase